MKVNVFIMKTVDQICKYTSRALDGRDINRLSSFLPEDKLVEMGMELKDEFKGNHVPEELTRENILKHLEQDLAFAFEKALNCRGISAGLMYLTIKMWNWILEEGLEDFDDDNYPMYGLPLLKATALKYGFDNPIGEDSGSEDKYNE